MSTEKIRHPESKNIKPLCGLPVRDEELKKILSSEQYRIMCQNGTETPFDNAYWNNKREGIYVDVITGDPLFSSRDKFDSGTGWPSFTVPIHQESIIEEIDQTHGMIRTEVRARKSAAHLGHVFKDGPGPTGLRYCMNSASLRFIPLENLEKEGYGEYRILFKVEDSLKNGDLGYKREMAAFSAGCFWGVEEAFRELKGVTNTVVGYMGGKTKNPTYEDVCSGRTGHAETVLVEYHSSEIKYKELIDFFWQIHNPTTMNRQGPDVGTQYRSIIFFYSSEQEREARLSKENIEKSGKYKNPIATEIIPAEEFYRAEDDHQRYFQKKGIKKTCHFPQK